MNGIDEDTPNDPKLVDAELVKAMRDAQKAYWKSRDPEDFQIALALESRVDKAVYEAMMLQKRLF